MATLGENIKSLRTKRGVTQETLAKKLGVTYQAVSKWENNSAMPDIQLLPAISVYFGVTIDELFDLSEAARLERIGNMLQEQRMLTPEVFQETEQYLLGYTQREPEDGEGWALLTLLHNHRAQFDHILAQEYGKKAVEYQAEGEDYHYMLIEAYNGVCPDWDYSNHHVLIEYYQDFVKRHPEDGRSRMWLCDQLIADGRLEEAREILAQMRGILEDSRCDIYEGRILAADGQREEAMAVWNRMVEKDSENWLVWSCRGDELARMGQYEAAIADYEKSITLQTAPMILDDWISIAHIYEIMGQFDQALTYYEKANVVLERDWHIRPGDEANYIAKDMERCRKKFRSV